MIFTSEDTDYGFLNRAQGAERLAPHTFRAVSLELAQVFHRPRDDKYLGNILE
jgi:hypothetical protein